MVSHSDRNCTAIAALIPLCVLGLSSTCSHCNKRCCSWQAALKAAATVSRNSQHNRIRCATNCQSACLPWVLYASPPAGSGFVTACVATYGTAEQQARQQSLPAASQHLQSLANRGLEAGLRVRSPTGHLVLTQAQGLCHPTHSSHQSCTWPLI